MIELDTLPARVPALAIRVPEIARRMYVNDVYIVRKSDGEVAHLEFFGTLLSPITRERPWWKRWMGSAGITWD